MVEKKASFKIWDVIKMFLLFVALQVLVGIFTVFLAIFIGFNTSNPLVSSLNSIVALALVISIISRKVKISIIENLKISNNHRKLIVSIFIFSLGLSIVISEIGNYITELFPMSERMIEIFNEIFSGEVSFIGTIIHVIIVAPIAEEVLFRGIMLKGLLKRYSAITSILVTALLFAIIHLNIYQFVGAFIAGLLLGWLYLKTESLLLCIISHAAYNSIGYILWDLLKLKIKGYTLEGFQPIWFTLFGVLLLIIFGIIIKKQVNNSELVDAIYTDIKE